MGLRSAHDEYIGLFVEWFPEQWLIGQFACATSIGWIVHQLSSPMVVSMTNVLPFQTVSQFLERIGFTHDYGGCGGWRRVGKQFCSGGVEGFWDCLNRLEQFQKNLIQSGHVSVRFHDLRKDVDQIDNVHVKITSGRI